MASFFVAVIFWCTQEGCTFSYSNDQFPNKHDCIMSMDQEIGKMRDPKLKVVSAHGSCLEFKQERRVLFTVSFTYPSLGR
jgi:hypothetical protein